jgi:hypothetical protein
MRPDGDFDRVDNLGTQGEGYDDGEYESGDNGAEYGCQGIHGLQTPFGSIRWLG